MKLKRKKYKWCRICGRWKPNVNQKEICESCDYMMSLKFDDERLIKERGWGRL